jgi:hypothetical protein
VPIPSAEQLPLNLLLREVILSVVLLPRNLLRREVILSVVLLPRNLLRQVPIPLAVLLNLSQLPLNLPQPALIRLAVLLSQHPLNLLRQVPIPSVAMLRQTPCRPIPLHLLTILLAAYLRRLNPLPTAPQTLHRLRQTMLPEAPEVSLARCLMLWAEHFPTAANLPPTMLQAKI